MRKPLQDLHSVEIISDRDVQALYVYLLTVVKSELSEYRENVETLPSKFKTSYSSALLSTPQEEPQRIKFEAIKRSWTAFTSVTDAVIDEFHKTGLISTAELLSIEKSLTEYHQQVNAVVEYEHRKSEGALLSLNQIIENSRLLSIVAASIGLAALTLIAVLMTKQANRFMTNQN